MPLETDWENISFTIAGKTFAFGNSAVNLQPSPWSDGTLGQEINGYIGIEANHRGAIPVFDLGKIGYLQGIKDGLIVTVGPAEVWISLPDKLTLVADSVDECTSPVSLTVC